MKKPVRRHVRSLNPTAKIVATADLLSGVNDLYEAGADYVPVNRISDTRQLYKVIEAAQAGLLEAYRDRCAARRTLRSAAVAITGCCPAPSRPRRRRGGGR